MKSNIIFFFTVALTFRTSVKHARTGDGLELFLDFGLLKVINNDTRTENQTSKIGSVQYNYQFTLDNSFSFSLLETEFSGKGVLHNTKYEYYKAGIIGTELRA